MSNRLTPEILVPLPQVQSESKAARPPRRARKPRIRMETPQPMAIRSHWEWANDAQKEQAQTIASHLMEYWLGQASKQEVAEKLNVAPLRVWQLSNLAISGMLVGLLTQPKIRLKGSSNILDPLKDPKKLCEQIGLLEKRVAIQARLIEWLRALPNNRGLQCPSEVESTAQSITQELAAPKNAKPARKAKPREESKEA